MDAFARQTAYKGGGGRSSTATSTSVTTPRWRMARCQGLLICATWTGGARIHPSRVAGLQFTFLGTASIAPGRRGQTRTRLFHGTGGLALSTWARSGLTR